VKPVLFAAMNEEEALPASGDERPLPSAPAWFSEEVVRPLEERTVDVVGPYRDRRALYDTAVVIDLPAGDGAELGVALTEHGLRPVPLYNALPSRVAIVDVGPIMEMLVRGAEHVAQAHVSASPAFLLDADRMGHGRPVRPGLFDNRSICRSTDFPSVERFRQAGIRRVLLVCDTVQEDLDPIALEWQTAGLELWWKRPSERRRASLLTLRRPWLGRRIWNRFFRPGIQPRADGAYGALIEEASSG
jgi:hypothetical protein